ncbi:hypothetical protein BDN71DRAFT_1511963 [Pleurotus eryngii]|uniref:PX domain-containing protein n=1 Tax=Pleurotus eryngii TaxID=5323 RepID=A0A9P6DAE4_PLEER|nr:hypothetical protein BDN71DRAFT_1511963 [Pleurotus eryngii]
MMIGDFPGGTGNIEGPISPHNYKRAVYRSAPSHFSVEMLGPEKQGGSYSFGMRICPIITGDRHSVTSRGSHSEYEVWRRWEDCLWFQETIELEYERLARQKKQRLLKGKGVKKNGMYLQDQAASFESLPPGPDPNSVAQSIHDSIPKLTKKGTLFRASQATIDQRQKEISGLVEGLFRDDVPMLIHELRESRIVTDFFGYWRRDYDLDQKKGSKSRNSVSSSVFSMYFSQSNPNLTIPETIVPPIPYSPSTITVRTKRSQSSPANPMSSFTNLPSAVSSDEDVLPSRPRPRLSSQSSTSSSSSHDSAGSILSSASFIVPDDASIVIDHSSKLSPDYTFSSNRPSSRGLEALPEDIELSTKLDNCLRPPSAGIRTRRSSSAADANRVCHIYGTPPPSAQVSRTSLDRQSISPVCRANRESMISMASGTSIIDNLSGMLSDDGGPPDHRRNARDSICSVATFMTSSSAEAIIPLSLASSPNRHPQSSRLRPFSFGEEDEEDFIDPHLYDEFPMPQMPEGPPRSRYAPVIAPTPPRPQTASSVNSTQSSFFPPSPTGSAFTQLSVTTTSSSASPYDSFFVKAAYEGTIMLLRLPSEASFMELRLRLSEKFCSQGVRLPHEFALFLVIPSSPVSNPRAAAAGKNRDRSNSLASTASATFDQSRMRPIQSDQDWDTILNSMDGTKLTFRILDPANIS